MKIEPHLAMHGLHEATVRSLCKQLCSLSGLEEKNGPMNYLVGTFGCWSGAMWDVRGLCWDECVNHLKLVLWNILDFCTSCSLLPGDLQRAQGLLLPLSKTSWALALSGLLAYTKALVMMKAVTGVRILAALTGTSLSSISQFVEPCGVLQLAV